MAEPQSDLEDENDIEAFETRYYEEKTKEFAAPWERPEEKMEDSQTSEEDFIAEKERHEEKTKNLKEEYDNSVEDREKKGWTLPRGSASGDYLDPRYAILAILRG